VGKQNLIAFVYSVLRQGAKGSSHSKFQKIERYPNKMRVKQTRVGKIKNILISFYGKSL
jgi:hypothetical protein